MGRILALAVAAILLGVVACGDFGEDQPAPEEAVEDSGTVKKPKDAAVAAEAASSAPICEKVVDQPFSQAVSGGWDRPGNLQSGSLGIGTGPDGIPGLEAVNSSLGSLMATSLGRAPLISVPGLESAHAEFDFAFNDLGAEAGMGCGLGFVRSKLFGEVRLGFSLTTKDAFHADLGFMDNGSFDKELMKTTALTAPEAGTWVHVTYDLALASDGFVDATMVFAGTEAKLPRLMPRDSLDFDQVNVLCGILGVAGGGHADVFVKNLVVTACKAP